MTESTSSESLECRQHKSEVHALGMAVNLLRQTEPFSSYAFGPFAGNLMGQIKRKHYQFTVEGQRLVGYVGWALCDPDVAEAWLAERATPRYDQCLEGSCWIGLTWHSVTRAACLFQARFLRELYPDRRGFWRRDYGDRRRAAWVYNTTERPAGSPLSELM